MEVDLILKAAGIGLIITVVCQVMSKAGKDEQANLVSLVGMVVILALIVERVGGLVTNLKGIFGL
jgi:stage III sporulation protein AC